MSDTDTTDTAPTIPTWTSINVTRRRRRRRRRMTGFGDFEATRRRFDADDRPVDWQIASPGFRPPGDQHLLSVIRDNGTDRRAADCRLRVGVLGIA